MGVRLQVRFLCFPLSLGTLHRSAIAASQVAVLYSHWRGEARCHAIRVSAPLPMATAPCCRTFVSVLTAVMVAVCAWRASAITAWQCQRSAAVDGWLRTAIRVAGGFAWAVTGCSFSTGLALSRWQGCRLLWRSVMSAAIDFSTQEFAHARPFPASIVVRFQPASPG